MTEKWFPFNKIEVSTRRKIFPTVGKITSLHSKCFLLSGNWFPLDRKWFPLDKKLLQLARNCLNCTKNDFYENEVCSHSAEYIFPKKSFSSRKVVLGKLILVFTKSKVIST